MDIRTYIKQLDQLMKEYDAIYHTAAVAYGLSDTAMWILYMVSDATETYTQQDLCRQCKADHQHRHQQPDSERLSDIGNAVRYTEQQKDHTDGRRASLDANHH